MKNNIAVSIYIFLLVLFPAFLFSQSPQSIPYQAVVRNTDGTAMSNAALTMIFKIHDQSATGTVVYQESHSVTSNVQGLVICNVGNGTPTQGTFANINWGNGAKFLHVLMDAGNGELDLGTQQMMSVPYALYAEQTNVRVSAMGDTLLIGGQSIVVPGISAANAIIPLSNSGLGSELLPGNTTCSAEFISVTDCGGQTSLTYDGRTYDLVEIGGQCWFADNLATDQYRNGDPITTGLDNTAWSSTTSGAYSIYNADPINDVTYGKLYNWYTTVDNRGLCPSGWHVPTDCEWMYLEGSIGMTVAEQESLDWRGTNEGDLMKSPSEWPSLVVLDNNVIGFEGLPGGYRFDFGPNVGISETALWWSASEVSDYNSRYRNLNFDQSGVWRSNINKHNGFSIRCIRD